MPSVVYVDAAQIPAGRRRRGLAEEVLGIKNGWKMSFWSMICSIRHIRTWIWGFRSGDFPATFDPRVKLILPSGKLRVCYWSHGPVEIVSFPIHSIVIFPVVFCQFTRPGKWTSKLVGFWDRTSYWNTLMRSAQFGQVRHMKPRSYYQEHHSKILNETRSILCNEGKQ